jgi:hypothetical protein
MLQDKIKEIAAGSNYLFPAIFSGGCGGEVSYGRKNIYW